jgi:uncharacterized protein GlcG (DUF336 family)
MRPLTSLRSCFIRILLLVGLALTTGCHSTGSSPPPPKLTDDDIKLILDQAEAAAKSQPSLLRVNAAGEKQTTRMNIYIVNRSGRTVGRRSMEDAWYGSVSIADMKAYTAMSFSSDQNALTTRTIGALSQPGGPLWNIGNSNKGMFQPGLIEFPGGVPLYKQGVLVGGIGVSGDGVEEDEAVALAGSKGFEAPETIRVDTVTKGGVPYVK